MRRLLGILLLAVFALPGAAQDRTKKAYELMYEDIQALKLQTQRIEKRLDQSATDLKALGDLIRDLAGQFRDFQKFQARNQEGWGDVPGQVRAIQEHLSQIEGRLLQMAEDILSLKTPPAAIPPGPEEEKTAATKPGTKVPPANKTEPEAETKAPPPVSGLSAQELYDAAMADYSKGNFDLAIDGFNLYRTQFSASPLADDALHMVGESRFGQKKYAQAIESFDQLIMEYPVSGKLATAYLKKGYALLEMKKKPEAVAVLKLLISKYGLEEEAAQAREKLKELGEIK